jgi:hypothetical protein
MDQRGKTPDRKKKIPLGAWMSVCCECWVLSGRGLCDGLITRPEESYRVWCAWVWSWSLEKWGGLGPQGAVQPLGGRGERQHLVSWTLADMLFTTHRSIVTICTTSLHIKISASCAQCIYVFREIPIIQTDCFPIQDEPVFVSQRTMCSLRGTDRICIYNSD